MFVDESIHAVYHTLFEAIVLVFIVVLVFLQDWRATIIPMIAVPVSLIGTFAVMAMLGFSINNLSLFGLVLAIGIVVDDAIVVVENFERWLAEGLSPRDAARKAMDEVTGPVIAIALVLCQRVHSDGVHRRHQRPVLPAVRSDDRGLDDHLGVQFADAQPGAVHDSVQGPCRGAGHGHEKQPMPGAGVALLFGILAALFAEPAAVRLPTLARPHAGMAHAVAFIVLFIRAASLGFLSAAW